MRERIATWIAVGLGGVLVLACVAFALVRAG
jgi:hypothetical protein